MYSFVELNVKAGLFSSYFLFEHTFLGKSAFLIYGLSSASASVASIRVNQHHSESISINQHQSMTIKNKMYEYWHEFSKSQNVAVCKLNYYSLSVLTAVKKARLTSEFIYLARVLSNPQIPYQALTTKQFNTNKENYRGCNEDKTFTFILNLSFPFPLGCQSKVYGF